MDADLDTLATALYVRVDDELKIRPELGRWRPNVGLCPRLSDAELITMAVIQALLGFGSETRFLRFARSKLVHLFPYVPNQSGYNKRLRAAAGPLRALVTAAGIGWATRTVGKDGRALPCRARRDQTGQTCDHGQSMTCTRRHRDNDPALGTPLCHRCFDYGGAVAWTHQRRSCGGAAPSASSAHPPPHPAASRRA